MNILFVSDVYLPTVSGVASSTDSIVRFMAAQGHRVTLVCPQPLGEYVPLQAAGLEIVYTPGVSDKLFVNKSMTLFPLGFPVLWHVVLNNTFDIVHIQEPGSLGITALIIAKLFRLPVVGAQHFSWSQIERVAPPLIRWISVPFMKLYVRVIYAMYDEIMVPTATAARDLSALIGRSGSIHPVSNGVDTGMYTPRTGSATVLRAKYRLSKDIPVLLYIGRLDADKNIETILQALAITATPIRMMIAGVGKQKERLQSLATSLKLTNIIWMDEVQKQVIIDLYQLADAFVIMSPVETQSIVALQALACGLPLIAARAGALPELVDGKNGVLVDAYDVNTLASTIDRLASDSTLRKSMGAQSRKISLRHHKPTVLKRLEVLYKQTMHPSS
ncbi:MAG: glycosyltransferase [Patescibacteria group bacterium]